MSSPPYPYFRKANFVSYEGPNPTKPKRGTDLDAEFDDIERVLSGIQARAAEIQRDDGRLANDAVHLESLDSVVSGLLATRGGSPRGPWSPNTDYQARDVVEFSGYGFMAVTPHTSSVDFDADRASGLWVPVTGDEALRSDLADPTVGGELVGFLQYGAGAVARTTQGKLRDTVSVKDFGAVGDGVTDDRPAFQLALDYANSIGGASVAVPYSTAGYRLVGTFSIGSNTRLYGDGGLVRLIRGAAGSMLNNGLGYTTGSAIPAYGGHKNIVIENLIFDPDVANIPSGLTHLALGYGENILVRNCITLDGGTGHHVDMTACRDVRFENCKFLGTKLYGRSPSECEAIQLDNDKTGSFPYFGVATDSPCLRIKVTGCVFGPNPDNPDPDFISPPVGVGTHGNIAFGSFHQNIQIANCDFSGCSYAAVHARKWSDIKISGCTVFDCGDGVLIEAASAGESGHTEANAGRSFVVTHNTFSALSGAAVICAPITLGTVLTTRTMDLVIANNTVKGSVDDDAFDLRSARSVSVTGNIVDGNYRLLYAIDVERLTVSSNSVSNVQFEGIYIGAGCLDFSVTGNMIVGTQSRGVWITGGSKGGVVSGNQIKNFAISASGSPYGVYINSSSENIIVTGNNFSKSVATVSSGPDVAIAASCVDCSTANNTSNTGFIPVENSCASGISQGLQGSGSPEGVITAPVGSTYVNRSGGASTTFYVKTSGTGSSGWTAK